MFKILRQPTILIFTIGFLGILLIGIFTRLWQLNTIPVAFYFDEMDYVFTGEAVARFGTDVTGTWNPGQLRPLKTLNYTAELPALFHAGVQKIFGFGPENGHTPAALFGCGAILLAAFFMYAATRRWQLALVVAAIIAINPWHIHLSRMGYEAIISLFFQLSWLTALWFAANLQRPTLKTASLWIAVLLATLFLGYFTYHGAKVTLLALSGAGVVWVLFQKLPGFWKSILISVLVFSIGSLLAYSFRLQKMGLFGERQSEVITMEYVDPLVNDARRTALDVPAESLFINKPVFLVKEIIKRYAAVFDVNRLAINGYESGFQFSLIVHGFFYLSSLPLMLWGAVWLVRNHSQLGRFLLVMLAVSPAASAVTVGYQSIFRSALTYLLLLVFAAVGTYAMSLWIQKQRLAILFMLSLVMLFATEAINFSGLYFSRYAIVSADNHSLAERLLATYLSRVSEPVTIVSHQTIFTKARAIVAYNQLMPKLTSPERQQFSDPQKTQYEIGNITITQDCPQLVATSSAVQIVDGAMFEECHYAAFLATSSAMFNQQTKQLLLHSISSPIDSGNYFFLINDPVCQTDQLPKFVHTNQLQDFNLEKLSNEKFCQTWVKTELK